jgi:hypothetical protein
MNARPIVEKQWPMRKSQQEEETQHKKNPKNDNMRKH